MMSARPVTAAMGKTAGQRLRHRYQVRIESQTLAGKHCACARKSSLHFIGNHQNAVLAANLRERRKKLWRRRDESTLAKYGLDDHRGNRLGSNHALECVFDMLRAKHFARWILQRIGAAIAIGVRNPIDLGGERLEASLVGMRLARHGHRHVSTPVKCVFEGNDRGSPSVRARDLHGVFRRFGASGHKQSFLRTLPRHDCIQLLANCDVAFIRQHVEAGMQELVKLTAHSINDGGSAVPGVKAANAAGEVDQAIAVHVFDDGTFRLRNKDRRGVVGGLHDCGVAPLHQFLRTRSGNGSTQLNSGHDNSQFLALSSQLLACSA